MTEIKDSHRPRAEIKCGAGSEGRFPNGEPDFAGKSKRSEQLIDKKYCDLSGLLR